MGKNLLGRTIVVTGATSGIGFTAAKNLVKHGAFVIGVGRSKERNQTALEAIRKEIPSGHIEYLLADLAIQKGTRELSNNITQLLLQEGFSHLDALVNNAGVYLERKHMTDDGIEKTFAVNHLAQFILTHDLLPLLQASKFGKVLSISSYAHFTTPLNLTRIIDPWPYIGLIAYKRSKLCNVLFCYELNRRYAGVVAFAVDPGLVNTSIASKGSQGISHWVWRKRRLKGHSPEEASKTIEYLIAEDEVDTSKGYYFKDCHSKEPSRKARNPQLAQRLWQRSCELTGLNW